METHKFVRYWMLLGLFMLVIQVVVGGITRLTGSGLSITEWEIVTGTLPPLSNDAWQAEFDLYKDTPQYREINEGMEMGSIVSSGTFKFIYFWEWVHRFWARIMGFVFLFPLLFFLVKGWIKKPLLFRLMVVFLLAGLAASFGWIMVASGLVERPWVNAYKLAMHLTIAFCVYSFLWWTFLKSKYLNIELVNDTDSKKFRKVMYSFTALLWVQIFLGGIMSGMKAAVIYPTWPDMNGEFIPSILFQLSQWSVDNFNNYDQNLFMPALIHILHRTSAYILFFLGGYLVLKIYTLSVDKIVKKASLILGIILFFQVLLGILTVINSQGSIPVWLGVLHQAFALFLLTVSLFLNFRFKK